MTAKTSLNWEGYLQIVFTGNKLQLKGGQNDPGALKGPFCLQYLRLNSDQNENKLGPFLAIQKGPHRKYSIFGNTKRSQLLK